MGGIFEALAVFAGFLQMHLTIQKGFIILTQLMGNTHYKRWVRELNSAKAVSTSLVIVQRKNSIILL
jgi:hypothetical protein